MKNSGINIKTFFRAVGEETYIYSNISVDTNDSFIEIDGNTYPLTISYKKLYLEMKSENKLFDKDSMKIIYIGNNGTVETKTANQSKVKEEISASGKLTFPLVKVGGQVKDTLEDSSQSAFTFTLEEQYLYKVSPSYCEKEPHWCIERTDIGQKIGKFLVEISNESVKLCRCAISNTESYVVYAGLKLFTRDIVIQSNQISRNLKAKYLYEKQEGFDPLRKLLALKKFDEFIKDQYVKQTNETFSAEVTLEH